MDPKLKSLLTTFVTGIIGNVMLQGALKPKDPEPEYDIPVQTDEEYIAELERRVEELERQNEELMAAQATKAQLYYDNSYTWRYDHPPK